MSYFPALVPPVCLFLVQCLSFGFLPLSSKKGTFHVRACLAVFKKLLLKYPKNMKDYTYSDYLSQYMKASRLTELGWCTNNAISRPCLVCPHDGLARVKGRTRLFSQRKRPFLMTVQRHNKNAFPDYQHIRLDHKVMGLLEFVCRLNH